MILVVLCVIDARGPRRVKSPPRAFYTCSLPVDVVHLWFGKSAILGRFLKQKFDLSKSCSWCSNRGRKPAWPPHSQPNTITTKKRQFEFLKKGDYGTQQIFHTFDVLKCQTVSKYGTKRPCCVFLFCASALRTLTADKRIEK